MMTDDATTLALPRMISDARDGLARAGRRAWIDPIHPIRLVVAGPSGAGKTELVHALLGQDPHALPASASGRPTTRPVEFGSSSYDGVNVELAPDEQARTGPQIVPARADLLDSPRARRVLVSSTARPLRDWNLRIVDTPGVDARAGGMVELPEDVWSPGTAVLYVVPSRGVTETDVRALELLRAVPTVLVVNLLDAEVATSHSALEPVATPELASSIGVTLAVRRLSAPGPERAALCSVIALLRGLGTPTATLLRIRDHAWFARRELDDEYVGEFATLRRPPRGGNRIEAWELAARLVRLERRGPHVVSLGGLLGTVSSAAARTADVDALRDTVVDRARAVVDEYNVEGARRRAARPRAVRTTAGPAPAPTPLDGPLAEYRTALREVIDSVVGDTALLLTDDDRKVLRGVGEDVVRDRFEVAVVGQFSSGKSSLVNALLGVPHDTPLLPTAAQPETATINQVVWDRQVSLGVTWVSDTELTLLEPAPYMDMGGLAFRVRRVTPAVVTVDGEILPLSGVVETASSLTWRGGWRRFADLFGSDRQGWDDDITQNRDRVASAWRRSKDGAAARVTRLLDRAEAATLDELDRLKAGIAHELAAAGRTPSREAADEAQASLRSSEAWLTRLHSLTRTIERAAA